MAMFDFSKKEDKKIIVPLLPLRDVVVFPYMIVPLFVGREKSINALESAMKQDYETNENGKQVPVARGSYTSPDGQQVDYYALTQEDADKIKAVVDSATHTVTLDQNVTNMIDEEAAYFFKGEKTVDQTADIIQSRMNVFVNEQK